MKTQNSKHHFDSNSLRVEELLTLIFTAIIFLFLYINQEKLVSSKIPKSNLSGYYKIDKKTLNKWLRFFCDDLIPDFKIYRQRRKIEHHLFTQIMERLGNVNEHPVMTKKQLVVAGEGTYRSLRESIRKHPALFGISAENFARLNKFPPEISKRILEQY